MPSIILTVPAAGNKITAGLHATNYAALQALLNGGLDATNFASGQIFAPSKLTQEAASLGQGLVWNGSMWVPAGVVQSKYKKVTSKTVSNTIATTDLLNGEITIAANALSATGILRFTAWGTYTQNSGAPQALLRMALALGGTTLIDTNTVAAIHTSNVGAHPWKFTAIIEAQNATNAQFTYADLDLLITGGNAAATLAAGTGLYLAPVAIGGYSFTRAAGQAASAKDMTFAQALVLNVIQPAASLSIVTVLNGASVEIL